MYFQSELNLHSRILNRGQVQIFSMPNIGISQIASDYSHGMIVTCVNEHRFASDFAKPVGK